MITGPDSNTHFIIHRYKFRMFVLIVLAACSFVGTCANPFMTYDQRQSGELNVRIDLKNLKILALMKGGKEEYVDYDYAYDYSEMTIKPTNGTTPKPLNATVTDEKDNTTNSTPPSPTTIVLVQTTDSDVKNSTNLTPLIEAGLNEENYSTNKTIIADDTTVKTTVEDSTTYLPATSTVAFKATQTIRNCRRGFVLNNAGKCEYKIHGTSNALRRIVKLAQKIKIGRRYKENLSAEDKKEDIK